MLLKSISITTETAYMPSDIEFAESFSSGTRQTKLLPSVSGETLGKPLAHGTNLFAESQLTANKGHSAKRRAGTRQTSDTRQLSPHRHSSRPLLVFRVPNGGHTTKICLPSALGALSAQWSWAAHFAWQTWQFAERQARCTRQIDLLPSVVVKKIIVHFGATAIVLIFCSSLCIIITNMTTIYDQSQQGIPTTFFYMYKEIYRYVQNYMANRTPITPS